MDRDVISLLCDSIEDCLGLLDNSNGTPLRDEKLIKLLKEVSQEDFSIGRKRGSELVTNVALLSYMAERADVKNSLILNYSEFRDVREIERIIGEVNSKVDLDRKAQKRMDHLVSILSYIEKKSIDKRFSLEFRLLVLYLIFLDKYMFTEARIVQRFVKSQIGR